MTRFAPHPLRRDLELKWKEKSSARKPEKDKAHQRTLQVKRWLKGEWDRLAIHHEFGQGEFRTAVVRTGAAKCR